MRPWDYDTQDVDALLAALLDDDKPEPKTDAETITELFAEAKPVTLEDLTAQAQVAIEYEDLDHLADMFGVASGEGLYGPS